MANGRKQNSRRASSCYDIWGQLVEGNGILTWFVYYQGEHLQEEREGEVIRREHGYGLKDRKIQEKNPQGGITSYFYDRNDLLIKEIGPYGYGMDGGKEPGRTYRYDGRGNQIQETNSLGDIRRNI